MNVSLLRRKRCVQADIRRLLALRLNPPVPMNNREAIRDTVLPRGGGADGTSPILVPAGSIVGWHCYSMHRRTDIFGDDANDFRPERWTNLRPGWAYVPFNGGPRVCLGR
jgi:cytochrome P450